MESAFLAAIVGEPVERLHRLVYADWLDEHDRGDEATVMRNVEEMRLDSQGRVWSIFVPMSYTEAIGRAHSILQNRLVDASWKARPSYHARTVR